MRAGQESAYREFYDEYYSRLLRYLLVVAAGDEEAALEALQSTFVRVVRHIKVFPSQEVFWSWLTVLARSAFSDQSRKRRRYFAFLDRFTRHSQAQQADPESSETEARMQTALDRSLAGLQQNERQIVEWKYFSHRSVREIASELQTTEKTIESRLARTRRKLKLALLEDLRDE